MSDKQEHADRRDQASVTDIVGANELKYLQELYRLGSRLVRDPLSKTSRERQKLLLLTTVLTIGLAFSAITLKTFKGGEVEIGGGSLAIVFAIASLYLTFLFAVGAFQELNAENIRSSRYTLEFFQVNLKIQTRLAEKSSKLNEIIKQYSDLQSRKNAFRADMQNPTSEPEKVVVDHVIQTMEEELEVLGKQRDVIYELFKEDSTKSDQYFRVWDQAFRFRKWRILVEVYLPTTFGISGVLVAIAWILLHSHPVVNHSAFPLF